MRTLYYVVLWVYIYIYIYVFHHVFEDYLGTKGGGVGILCAYKIIVKEARLLSTIQEP